MDGGVVPPCPEDRLYEWLSEQPTNDEGLIKLRPDQIYFKAYRWARAGEEAFQHLEDAGLIERVPVGRDEESYRFRVNQGGNPPTQYAARRWESSLRLDDPSVGRSLGGSMVVGDTVDGGMERSVKKLTTVYLAKFFFPQVSRKAGIRVDPVKIFHDAPSLAHQLDRWLLQGIDLLTMKLMMEEFSRHPEWCRRSKTTPWRLFIAKRGVLASMVDHQKEKDPANRRWSGGKDWFRHTPRAISPV